MLDLNFYHFNGIWKIDLQNEISWNSLIYILRFLRTRLFKQSETKIDLTKNLNI